MLFLSLLKQIWSVSHSIIKQTCVFLLFPALLCAQKKFEPEWHSLDTRQTPSWFTDAKFGIFIHWGVYSVPAWGPTGKDVPTYSKYAEWYWNRMNENSEAGKLFREHHNAVYGEEFRYQDFAPKFKAENFRPAEWADLFAASGAKYVVLTSKHHEGFTLWPSKESWNWNSVDIGPHRDLAGELSAAVKAKGLYMGYYYSLYEWYNPLYLNNFSKYVDDHMIPQMKDLVNRYKPDILWTDGEWEHSSSEWKSPVFLSWLFNESPVREKVVVNDRWGRETRGLHGGVYTTEYDLVYDKNKSKEKITHPWEECRGIGGSFGYNRAEKAEDYATSDALIRLLAEKVAHGGNLLLDIGPTADGRIPVIMQQRLQDIGKWLHINGEAIYGTSVWETAPGNNAQQTQLLFTRSGRSLYVLCTAFPEKKITLENIAQAKNVSLLGFTGKIKYTHNGKKIFITPPVLTPANNSCRSVWVFKIENAFK